MFELSEESSAYLKTSTRLVVRDLLARGYKVYGVSSAPSFIQVELPRSRIPMRLYSVLDERTSHIGKKTITDNKHVTNILLGAKGIPIADELYVKFSEIDSLRSEIEEFIKKYQRVVVKPVDGAHGKGVSIGLQSYQEIIRAVEPVRPLSDFDGFLIQQQLDGVDIRVLCIDGTFVGAMTRVPASVMGNGRNTISELISSENIRTDRGYDYNTGLNKIDLGQVAKFMSDEDMHRIPPKGETVAVVGISNVGVGGSRENIDEMMPQCIIEMAEAVAEELRLPVCGIDFFVQRLPKREDTLTDLNPVVIEVNGAPGIAMYNSIDDPRLYKLVTKLVDSHIAAHYQRYSIELE